MRHSIEMQRQASGAHLRTRVAISASSLPEQRPSGTTRIEMKGNVHAYTSQTPATSTFTRPSGGALRHASVAHAQDSSSTASTPPGERPSGGAGRGEGMGSLDGDFFSSGSSMDGPAGGAGRAVVDSAPSTPATTPTSGDVFGGRPSSNRGLSVGGVSLNATANVSASQDFFGGRPSSNRGLPVPDIGSNTAANVSAPEDVFGGRPSSNRGLPVGGVGSNTTENASSPGDVFGNRPAGGRGRVAPDSGETSSTIVAPTNVPTTGENDIMVPERPAGGGSRSLDLGGGGDGGSSDDNNGGKGGGDGKGQPEDEEPEDKLALIKSIAVYGMMLFVLQKFYEEFVVKKRDEIRLAEKQA